MIKDTKIITQLFFYPPAAWFLDRYQLVDATSYSWHHPGTIINQLFATNHSFVGQSKDFSQKSSPAVFSINQLFGRHQPAHWINSSDWGSCADHDPWWPGLSRRHRPTCRPEHQQQRSPDVKPRPERFPRNGDTSALRRSVILLEMFQLLAKKSANHQLMTRKSILISNKPSMIQHFFPWKWRKLSINDQTNPWRN